MGPGPSRFIRGANFVLRDAPLTTKPMFAVSGNIDMDAGVIPSGSCASLEIVDLHVSWEAGYPRRPRPRGRKSGCVGGGLSLIRSVVGFVPPLST